jgi:two-component system, NtrC family, sensor histidine kinase AtoS
MERHDCIETKVVMSGQVIYFEDSMHDPQATEIDRIITKKLGRGRIVYAPLTVKGKIIGCMGVNRPIEGAPISKSEIEAFTIFANQASIIIENSRFSEQLVAERNLNKNILESSPDGILTVDRKGKIIALNKEAARILSVDPEEILSKDIGEAARNNRSLKIFKDILLKPEDPVREYDYIGADGKRHYIEIATSPLEDNSGNETGTLFLFEDQTEKKAVSEQLQRMSKLAAIGQLAAGISHEIRNPLMGIGATLEMVSETFDPDHPQRRLLLKSMEEIERIDNIISDLLNLARPREMNLQPADVNRMIGDISDALAGLCRKENVVLALQCEPRIPFVCMDREKMREVIVNITLNAIQSMKRKGTLKIATLFSDRKLCHLDRGSVQITIEDTGEGIPHEIKDKVFDPFFTTKPEGTGLGLYNCHKIIEAHGGAIFVEDAPIRGTRVNIFLPARPVKGGL